MSKTSEKRAARAAEHAQFIKERRMVQAAMFDAALEATKSLFESSKDKLTPEQLEEAERQIAERENFVEVFKKANGL